MKRITSLMSTVIMMAVLTTVFSLTSCKKESQPQTPDKIFDQATLSSSERNGAPLKVELVRPTFNIEDANMHTPVGDATLLWNNVGHIPVLAPDGHQVTLGEFQRVSGYANIKCVNKGTHVVVHLMGLIPKGVYTIWVVTFKAPGFDPTFANQIGEGSLGAPDGSQNAFTASQAGTASLSVIMPAGSLSRFGSVGTCLSSEYEVHFAAAYHLDGLTHGGSPGAENTFVIQFAFPFYGSQL